MANDNDDSFGRVGLNQIQVQVLVLQGIEDTLVDAGEHERLWATERGTFTWRTTEAERARSLPAGPEPTKEEIEIAMGLIAASPSDHARLSWLIARALADRRPK